LHAEVRHLIINCRDGADVCWNVALGSGGKHWRQDAAVANERRCFESDSSVTGV
jgi:hypothetical protein